MKLFPNSMLNVIPDKGTGIVGVITRTQNRPILLARALASVLSQHYENWRLFVVNDGGSVEPIEKLIKPFRSAFGDRLTLIHRKESCGMEAASNAGLEAALATGCEFICVHDDDDSWDPQYLTETTNWLESNPTFAAAVTEKVIVKERIEDEQYVVEEGWESGFVPKYITFGNMTEANQFPPICLTVRSSVCRAIGNFNEGLPVLGDWDYHLRILLEGDIGVIPKKLAYYHLREVATDAYGNTVTVGVQRHEIYGAQFTNSMMRQLIKENPGYISLMHTLLRSQRDHYEEHKNHLGYIERALVDLRPVIQEQAKQVNKILTQLNEIQANLTQEPKNQKSWFKSILEKFK